MNTSINLAALKDRQQAAWASGNYAVVGTTLQIVGEQLAETCDLRYRSAAHFIEVFRTWYGPIHKAFLALPAEKALALDRDLTELLARMNRAGPGSLVVPSEYIEVVVSQH